MTEPTKNLREQIANINPKQLIYPGIVFLFFIIVAVIFFLATQFITANINKAFLGDVSSEPQTLNIENYTLVLKKLGINTVTNGAPETIETTITPETEDKKSITIQILNSTTKKGVAKELAQTLESAGFTKPTTGDQNKLIPNTTILIKESRASFASAILEEVKKIYTGALATTTPETEAFDVTIVIGTK